MDSPVSPAADRDAAGPSPGVRTRSRSSTLIWHPEDHGQPHLPAIAVEDTTDDGDDDDPIESPLDTESKPIMAHTARPPVELMH